MALITEFFCLGVVWVLACLMLALGLRLLQWLRVAQDLGALEELLFAAGISFAILGVVTFAIGTVGSAAPRHHSDPLGCCRTCGWEMIGAGLMN